MNKLAQIRKALQENPHITIVGVLEKNHLPHMVSGWSHTVDFYVAPKIGGIYTAKELQTLMMSLVPRLEPTCKDSFCDFSHEMSFGKLYFDENIGTKAVRHEIVLTDENVFSSKGFVDGKKIIEFTEKIQRRTWVNLFPNVQIATAALKGENKYGISMSELKKSRGIVARLDNAFT